MSVTSALCRCAVQVPDPETITSTSSPPLSLHDAWAATFNASVPPVSEGVSENADYPSVHPFSRFFTRLFSHSPIIHSTPHTCLPSI